MKFNIGHIALMLFITLKVVSQKAPNEFETEFPITMAMTPMIDKSKLINDNFVSEEKKIEMWTIGEEEYNLNFLSHTIKNFSYGMVVRLENGLPIYSSMALLKDISFFDICWNYELENINFSVSIINLLNFRDSILELEPYLEKQSLVAEGVYFNQEATSMIQASIQYRF